MNEPNGHCSSTFPGQIDWGNPFLQSTQPNLLAGSGLECKTERFDEVFNSQGDKVILAAGESYRNRPQRGEMSALVVTKIWNRYRSDIVDGSRLEVRSPYMKAAMKATIPEFEKTDINTKHIIINNEPHCLFHYRYELESYGQQIEINDPVAANHVHFLLSYMWQEFMCETITYLSSVELVAPEEKPSIDFASIWMVFRPGDLVYIPKKTSEDRRQEIVMKFQKMIRRCSVWELLGHSIYRGEQNFGHAREAAYIRWYDGLQPIYELPAVPLRYHPDQEDIRNRIVQRGRKYVSYTSATLLEFSGVAHLLSGGLSLMSSDMTRPHTVTVSYDLEYIFKASQITH